MNDGLVMTIKLIHVDMKHNNMVMTHPGLAAGALHLILLVSAIVFAHSISSYEFPLDNVRLVVILVAVLLLLVFV